MRRDSFNPRGTRLLLHSSWIKRLRSFLIPSANAADLRQAGLLAVGGTLIAGCFGILHDQITYTISPEYFTRMKFDQFNWADVGLPVRVFVAEIGFLATWWVGLISAWFLARIAMQKFENPQKRVMGAMAIMVGITVLCGITGYFFGPGFYGNRPGWSLALQDMGVTDPHAFYQVSGIHLGSYVGGLIGWLLMMAAFLKAPRQLREK